ncbi:hypothetical protein HAX54_019096, partial [Datura stramonium]|nr:hypothetical protein [Datura stramonium]
SHHMKVQADKKRSASFKVDDCGYIKLQPYRQHLALSFPSGEEHKAKLGIDKPVVPHVPISLSGNGHILLELGEVRDREITKKNNCSVAR